MPTWIARSDKSETEKDSNAALREFEDELREAEETIDFQMNMNRVENLTPTGELGMYYQPMLLDFPKMYLREIERLLWPKWYTACFMKDYRNSSVWGNYRDKHKGACLIFESVKTDEPHRLELSERAGKGLRTIPLYEVIYANKPGEVDFFRSIGRTTVEQQLMELWYTDAEGNVSECAAHIPRDDEIDNDDTVAWRKSYWDSFYRDITAKTKDWEYEQEYRLILADSLRQFDEQENRTLKYNFNSLKGIIFGIKTSDQHRLRIIEIIQEKCEKYERTNFKFYQAYYSPENGDIRKHEIQVDDTLSSG